MFLKQFSHILLHLLIEINTANVWIIGQLKYNFLLKLDFSVKLAVKIH